VQAGHPRAMRPGWLAWAAFVLGQFGHGFSRIQLRKNPFASLYIRLYWCGYATEMRRTG